MNYTNRKERKSESGRYIIVTADASMGEGDESSEMTFCENLNGDYIGSLEWGERLCDEMSISPELRTGNSQVCSIGLSDKDGKWYGWSHRAIYGFEIGSELRQGDCGFKPSNLEEFIERQMAFWLGDDCYHGKQYTIEPNGITVMAAYDDTIANEDLHWTTYKHFCQFPEKYGRGQWTAKTMEDAREMACDFAEGVD